MLSKALKENRLKAIIYMVLATIACYIFGVNNKFVYWDDHQYILENPYLKDITWSNLTLTTVGNFHPLTNLINSLLLKIGGTPVPQVYHLFQLLVHCMNLVILFKIFEVIIKHKESKDYYLTAVLLILYSIHPFKVESVMWVSEIKDVCYSCFYLLGIYYFITTKDRGQKLVVKLAFIFVVSLLFKSMAITLPAVLFLYNKVTGRYTNKELTWLWAVMAVIGLYFISKTLGTQASSTEMIQVKTGDKPLLLLYTIGFYIGNFIIPYKQSIVYEFPNSFTGSLNTAYCIAGAGLLILIGGLLWRGKKDIGIALIIFLVIMLPVLQIIPIGRSVVSERYSYLSYAVLILLIRGFMEKRKEKVYLIGIVVALVVINTAITFGRIKVWKDTITLMEDFVKKEPKYYFSHETLGYEYYRENMESEAVQSFLVAESLFNSYKQKSKQVAYDKEKIYTGLGISFAKAGKKEIAKSFFLKSYQTGVNGESSVENLVNVYRDLGNKDSCRYYYKIFNNVYKKGQYAAEEYLNQ